MRPRGRPSLPSEAIVGPMCGVPFVGEEGVGHLTLGNPRGIKRQKEKARQRYLSAWAAQSAIPSVEEQRLVVFTMWAKKCSEKWLQVENPTCSWEFYSQILLKMLLSVSFSGTLSIAIWQNEDLSFVTGTHCSTQWNTLSARHVVMPRRIRGVPDLRSSVISPSPFSIPSLLQILSLLIPYAHNRSPQK